MIIIWIYWPIISIFIAQNEHLLPPKRQISVGNHKISVINKVTVTYHSSFIHFHANYTKTHIWVIEAVQCTMCGTWVFDEKQNVPYMVHVVVNVLNIFSFSNIFVDSCACIFFPAISCIVGYFNADLYPTISTVTQHNYFL